MIFHRWKKRFENQQSYYYCINTHFPHEAAVMFDGDHIKSHYADMYNDKKKLF